jgi:hypothetical protein
MEGRAVSAVRLLAEAAAAGVTVQLEPDGRVRLAAEREPPAHLLTELRAHKPELVALLRGERCRHCGERIDWRQPNAVTFANGWAAHLACYELVELPLAEERPANDNGGGLEPLGIILDETGAPAMLCGTCDGHRFHQAPGERWRCSACASPPLPRDGAAMVGWSFCALPTNPDALAWDNDRAWLDLWRAAGPLADRRPVVEAWIAAAPAQPLPRTLAAVELARIAREHDLVIEIDGGLKD